MNKYRVSWVIELEAESAEAAARQALVIQRDPSSIATVFDVAREYDSGRVAEPQSIDLTELAEASGAQPRKARDYVIVTNGKPAQRFSTRAAAMAYAKRHLKNQTFQIVYRPE